MLVLIILGILITVSAVALTLHAVVTDDPGARRHRTDYDSRQPAP